ncbi:YrdB family protein [Jatrophihabitans sp. DSM 45814]
MITIEHPHESNDNPAKPPAQLAILPTESQHTPTVFEVAVFLAELWMLAVLAVVGARLGNNIAVSIALAILLPTAASALWAYWLAPRAGHRLPHPLRLLAKLALVVAAAALLGLTGSAIWAAVFGVVAGALFATGEIRQP